MPPKPTIVRASSLSGYADCHRRGAARIFREEIEAAGYTLRQPPQGIGATIGTAVHKAAAITLAEKAKSGANPPLSVATDATHDSLKEGFKYGPMWDRMAQDENRAEHQAMSMTGAYHAGIVPTVEPIMSEQRLEATVGNGLTLSGQADQVCREPGAIRDIKTGMRRGHHRIQISAYSLLARSHGIEIDHGIEDFVKRCGPRTPQAPAVSYSHDLGIGETAAMAVLGMIAADIKGFREGRPEQNLEPGDPWNFPANANSVLCSEKYCPCFRTNFCHEWRDDKLADDDA